LATPASERPVASFVLSLIAGLLIVAGSAMVMGFSSGLPHYGDMMGGFFFGAILGVVGGTLALTWKK